MMSTKAGGTDHLFLFTYANIFFLHIVLVLIFSVYLFIYSKRCQQKQVKATTCFYLLMEITCCETWFSFEYSVSIYLFISTKAGGTDDLYFLMEITCCETWFLFEYSLSIYLFIQSDVNKNRWN